MARCSSRENSIIISMKIATYRNYISVCMHWPLETDWWLSPSPRSTASSPTSMVAAATTVTIKIYALLLDCTSYLTILITQQYLLQLFSVMASTIILHSPPLLLVPFFSFVPSTDISPYARIFSSSGILVHSTYTSFATYSLTATHLLFENYPK